MFYSIAHKAQLFFFGGSAMNGSVQTYFSADCDACTAQPACA
jgi:hypothetical protein